MAKTDTDLFRRLRDSGVRKKLARSVSSSSADSGRSAGGRALLQSADRLREVADALERGVKHSENKRVGKKAAETRKRNAAKRSAAAKKGARTRKQSAKR
jgi:hypothetical protein